VYVLPLNLDDYLLSVLQHAAALVPFDSGVLLLYQADADLLLPRATLGVDNVLPVMLDEGVIGHVAHTKRPLRIPDMQADDRAILVDEASRAELAVPLLVNDMLVGVLNVECHTPDAYTPEHEALLLALMTQAALMVIANGEYRALQADRDTLRLGIRTFERELAALQRLATITSTTRHLDDMLISAVREAAELLDCGGARLLIPDQAAYALVDHRQSRFGVARDWPHTALPLDGEGRAVHVYHTGAPYISQGADPDADVTFENELICPLNTHDRTLGVLELVNQRTGQFTDQNLELAQTIANQIALSMGSVQRFAAERRRAEMLSRINRVSQELYTTLDPQDLLHVATTQMRDVLGQNAVFLLLLTPGGETLHTHAASAAQAEHLLPDDTAFPVDTGMLTSVLHTGQALIVSDTREVDQAGPLVTALPWMRSTLLVPLRQSDELIGVLVAASTALYAFTDLDRDALETLATQVSIALDNAQLHHQAQRRLIEQQIVHQIGQDLSAILDFSELTDAIVQHMNRALNTSACTLVLSDEKAGAVRVEADFRGPRHHDQAGAVTGGQFWPLESRPRMHDAIRSREPVTAYRVDPTLDDTTRELLEGIGDHAQLLIAMVAGGHVIGVVDWTDNQPGRRFVTEDILLARTLVAQATIALENALLFRQLKEHAHELAEAYRLRSQFLATMSHELRTPMNSIIGFSETLMDGIYGDLTERQTSALERIRRNGYGLLTMIDDLLDLSKIEAGRMQLDLEIVGIGDAVQTAVQTVHARAAAKNLDFIIDVPDDLPRVEADPERLHQVIFNLINNAVKFTAEGSVTVRCEPVLRDGRPFIQTAVIDTGIGISQVDREVIFETFRQVDGSSTRQYGGSGMGLAITQKLVEMMGGDIWVDSTPGEGSTFTFVLPVATSERLGAGR
jgi:signal transduction histidine kinase/putative methionine-R-sulfoxide reductase with GAF domain